MTTIVRLFQHLRPHLPPCDSPSDFAAIWGGDAEAAKKAARWAVAMDNGDADRIRACIRANGGLAFYRDILGALKSDQRKAEYLCFIMREAGELVRVDPPPRPGRPPHLYALAGEEITREV